MKARGLDSTFRATGQTGIMISGEGIALDTIVGDYIAGAAELLSPSNKPNHWDLIEGQGSILHPSHAGVPLSLLHGSQPDAFVLCHEPTRRHMVGSTYPIPSIAAVREATEYMGRLTNPNIRCVGISLNTSAFQGNISQLKQQLRKEHNVPVVDPVIDGTDVIIDYMHSIGLLTE
ncbi:MAG TPA: NAD-dependent epimerase/dehydratase family protein [Patescibacteria group bacterium]|nr:NAD-dependent epimerase/dehydratase family protein [Patescibacteria group bacterium]